MQKRTLLIFLLTLAAAPTFAQSLISTPVILAIKSPLKKEYRSKAFFSMNSSSRDWSGKVILTPILEDKNLRDSLNAGHNPLALLLSGSFPIGIPDLVSAAEHEKNVNLEMKLQVGDSVQTKLVSVTVTQLSNKNLSPQGHTEQNTYLGKLNFVISLDPFRFGLNRAPFNIKNQILVNIEYGSVNKL